jgi:hypothetical protein
MRLGKEIKSETSSLTIHFGNDSAQGGCLALGQGVELTSKSFFADGSNLVNRDFSRLACALDSQVQKDHQML